MSYSQCNATFLVQAQGGPWLPRDALLHKRVGLHAGWKLSTGKATQLLHGLVQLLIRWPMLGQICMQEILNSLERIQALGL